MVENVLSLENARIIFRNFSGKEGRYNREGDRSFCVLLDNEQLTEDLIEDGWNVRILKPREEGDEPKKYMSVDVSYRNIPPKIFMITEKNKVLLNEDTVGNLDYADIRTADLIIRPYNWEVNGKRGVKAYLKTAYITIDEDRFASKYEGDSDAPF